MAVRVIEAKKQKAVKLKVAAYCRVSTENNDQLESLETQKEHYESWIRLHDDWEYVGIYYDSGISGTGSESRDGLQSLCRIAAAVKSTIFLQNQSAVFQEILWTVFQLSEN